MNYFKKHWKGEYPLWVSFWINGILFSLAWSFPFSLSIYFSGAEQNPALLMHYLFWLQISFFFIFIWQTVGVYRSSIRYEKKVGDSVCAKAARLIFYSFILGNLFNLYMICFKSQALFSAWNGDV